MGKPKDFKTVKNFCCLVYDRSKYELSNLLIAIILLQFVIFNPTYHSFFAWVLFIFSIIIRNIKTSKITIIIFLVGILAISANLFITNKHGYSLLLGILTAIVVIPTIISLIYFLYISIRSKQYKHTLLVLTQILILALYERIVGNIEMIEEPGIMIEILRIDFNSYVKIFDTYFIFYMSTFTNLFLFYIIFISMYFMYILMTTMIINKKQIE